MYEKFYCVFTHNGFSNLQLLSYKLICEKSTTLLHFLKVDNKIFVAITNDSFVLEIYQIEITDKKLQIIREKKAEYDTPVLNFCWTRNTKIGWKIASEEK